MKLPPRILLSIVLWAVSLSVYGQNTLAGKVDEDLIARSNIKTNFEDNYSVAIAAGMELLDDDDNSVLIDDLLDFAHEHLGTRYVRGGKRPGGFDCSGFTHYVFSQFGYDLNADSRSQFLQGNAVEDKTEIEPGDLLFFSGRSGGKKVGHVGIAVEVDYETGEVTFIHAATSTGISIDSTSAPYYARRYLGARRIIGVE